MANNWILGFQVSVNDSKIMKMLNCQNQSTYVVAGNCLIDQSNLSENIKHFDSVYKFHHKVNEPWIFEGLNEPHDVWEGDLRKDVSFWNDAVFKTFLLDVLNRDTLNSIEGVSMIRVSNQKNLSELSFS